MIRGNGDVADNALHGPGIAEYKMRKGKNKEVGESALECIKVFLKKQSHSELLYFDTGLASIGENLH